MSGHKRYSCFFLVTVIFSFFPVESLLALEVSHFELTSLTRFDGGGSSDFKPSTSIAHSDGVRAISSDSLISSVIMAIERGVELADYANSQPGQFAKLERNLAILREANAAHSLISEQSSFKSIAHAQQSLFNEVGTRLIFSDEVEAAIGAIDQVNNFPDIGLAATLEGVIGEDETAKLLKPLELDLASLQLADSMNRNSQILARYEKKFGPGSVQLNPVETLFNYLFQGVPGFGPDQNGNPGAGEWIAAYNTSYLTYQDINSKFQLVAAAEVGYRHYFLGDGWGEGSPIRPRYMSLGALFAGSDDGALITPWQGDQARFGAFASWGDYKFAYLFGDESRFLFTRQFQIFDHVF